MVTANWPSRFRPERCPPGRPGFRAASLSLNQRWSRCGVPGKRPALMTAPRISAPRPVQQRRPDSLVHGHAVPHPDRRQRRLGVRRQVDPTPHPARRPLAVTESLLSFVDGFAEHGPHVLFAKTPSARHTALRCRNLVKRPQCPAHPRQIHHDFD